MVRGILCAALVALMGVAGSGLAMAQTGSASADPLADFYAGKTMTIIVGSEPGGTYDLYGRTLARHLGKYMPGKPTVIVQNMTGAGSFLAARRVVSVAAQDGLTLGALGAALPYQQLYDPASPPLDIARINWIGSTTAYHMFMLVRGDSPVRTVADLRIHETVQSTIAPGQSNSLIVAVVREALGARIKGINGHKSMNDAMFALQRGEINGYPSAPEEALRRIYGKQLADGDIRLVLQFGPEPLKAYPDVPWAQALAANEDDRNLIDLATGFLKTGYVYMTGPDVPRDRVAAIRKAFMQALADPELLAEARQQTLNIAPIDGDTIAQLLSKAYDMPPPVIARMRRIFVAP
jgi:tripartite-type tricarboxylate transporter receptor subunit TctC